MKIHLGCGRSAIPGFVNVDQADFPHVHHRTTIARLAMFEDDAADVIYCSHAFQYFDRQQGVEVLREWRRVLKPGGLLRLAVPDFAALTDTYLRTGNLNLLLGPLYGRLMVTSAEPAVIYHKTAYDYSSLEAVLEQSGFCNVRRYDWRRTIHRDYDDCSQAYIPHLDKTSGHLVSLNVEADKPGNVNE